MSKILTLAAAAIGLFVLSSVGPASAEQSKADGIQQQQTGNYEVSDQRRYRRYHRRYYRPYYRPYGYYGGYPYGYAPYGYYRPYGYWGGAPGFSFGFRF